MVSHLTNDTSRPIGRQCRRYGVAKGAVPPLTAASAPNFGLLKLLFLEYHATTRQQTMMEGKRNNVQT